jgi:hypothetical protein
MAYTFTNATLLGYEVNKNYLGEGLFTLNTIKNISIEGIFLNLKNTEGVQPSFQTMSGLLTGIVNQYDSVIVNGYDLGSGKILNLSFPEKNPIRLGKYIYKIEILEKSDFSNAPSGDIYGTYLSGVSDKIVSLDENINFDYAENGDYSYNHGINIQFYDDKVSNLFDKAKNFANSAFYDTLNIGLIGPFSGFYNTLKNKKNYFTETYDLINKRCGFSKKILINKNYNVNYTTTLNHSLNFESNGKITVEEQGTIKALDNTLNYTAENYLQDTINGGDLPDTILLEGWGGDQGNMDINGIYVFYYTIFRDSLKNVYLNLNKISPVGGIIDSQGIQRPAIYFDIYSNYWVHDSNDFGWINSSTDSNILPLNGWIIQNAVGPAGSIKKGSYIRCQDIYNTYNQKYNLGQVDSLFNQPFTFGRTKDWFNNTLQYNISYVNDPAFEGNIINTYNITVSKDIQDIATYSEQGELTQVGQIGDITGLNLIKTKYQAAKTRASTNYSTYKLKSSSFSAGSLNSNSTSTYNNNFSYSIEKTSDNSIIEGHPLYKSLTFKIDDQTPTNLYKEYIIPNRDIKNILFLFGNQVEIGSKTVNINGTLVRPTSNFWQTPITFPLNDLKSKSISGAFDLVSTEAFIDGVSYEYDSDNNFSFNLNVKYLKKI